MGKRWHGQGKAMSCFILYLCTLTRAVTRGEYPILLAIGISTRHCLTV